MNVARKPSHRKKARINFEEADQKFIEIQILPSIAKHKVQLLNISSTGMAVKITHDQLENIGHLSPQDIVYVDLQEINLDDELPVLEIVRITASNEGIDVGFRFKCITPVSANYLDSKSKKESLMNLVLTVEKEEILSFKNAKKREKNVPKWEAIACFLYDVVHYYRGQKFKLQTIDAKTVVPEFFRL